MSKVSVGLCVGMMAMAGCGGHGEPKEPLAKRLSKFVTKQAVQAAGGVAEALSEDGAELGQAVGSAATEVTAGVVGGVKEGTDRHGAEMGSNVVSTIATIGKGAVGQIVTEVEMAENPTIVGEEPEVAPGQ